jgi:hypothetical protein
MIIKDSGKRIKRFTAKAQRKSFDTDYTDIHGLNSCSSGYEDPAS